MSINPEYDSHVIEENANQCGHSRMKKNPSGARYQFFKNNTLLILCRKLYRLCV
jgi:hypothetical protein